MFTRGCLQFLQEHTEVNSIFSYLLTPILTTRMYQQNEPYFEGLYLGHFWSEFKNIGQGSPLDLRDSKSGQKFGVL